ncbi:MAG: hypothetical protein D4R65_03270 [Verrucomicrobiaceae bacterium]|nr:MAG: hypothetical protein D4R65_03270 [Verrucomicrobiaceae bacterium]
MKQLPAAMSVLVILVLGIGGLTFLANSNNVRASAGYASYVYSKPIVGRSEFKGVLIGPASSGLRWRLSGQNVSITPFTYSEKFDGNTAILAKDKLPLSSQAHIVWRLKPDEASVKQFMEEFGGWEKTGDPDEIAKQAYAQFIMEPFRTVTRSVVAKYTGLSVNESLPEISAAIGETMKDMLSKTPFEILSVVMGNAAPPQQVIDAIATKVALNQTLEQKSIEEEIATKNVEIERKNGEASGAKAAAEAVERAKAISSISAVLTPSYIQYLGMENIRGADRVYVPLGGASPQLVLPVK